MSINIGFPAPSLQRFSSVPKVLATARHSVNNRPQDAMNVWIEELKQDYFMACLREVKTFDGKHQNLQVVSFHRNVFCNVIALKAINDFCLEKLFDYYENNCDSRNAYFLFAPNADIFQQL